MEKGSFDSELNLSRPDDDAESSGVDKDKDKKKKRKTDPTKADTTAKEKEGAATAEAKDDEAKLGAPESFGALLERMTRDLKPEDKDKQEAKEGSALSRLFRGEKVAEEPDKAATDAATEKPAAEQQEHDPSLEHLSEEERREAAEVYIDDRQRDVAEEIEASEPESAKSESARAVEEFLEATRAKLKVPERTVDEAVDESFTEVVQKYAPEAAAATEAQPDNAKSESARAVADELPTPLATMPESTIDALTFNPDDVIEEVDNSDVVHAMEYEDFVSPEADLPPVMAAGEATSLPLSHEEDMPPDTWGAPYQLYDNPMRVRHELIPDPLEATVVQPTPPETMVERQQDRPESDVPSVPVGTALVVGFAAYLYGRRRGRIKTEKRLLPIQKSLEREVRTIHEKLAAQETQLRRLVHQQASLLPLRTPTVERRPLEQSPVAVTTTAERAMPAIAVTGAAATLERPVMTASTPEKPDRPFQSQPEPRRQPLESQPTPLGSRPEFTAPLQAGERFSPPPIRSERPAEQRGSFLSYSPEVSRMEAPKPERANVPAEVAMMPHGELMKAADEIVVGAATMRQVFETNLISERGLRRIVAEHRRGGDVRAILTEELMLKEMGYERDPRVRDNPLSQQRMPGVSGSEAKETARPTTPSPMSMAASAAAAPVLPPAAPTAPPPATPPPLPSFMQPSPYQPPQSPAQQTTPSTLVIANVVAVAVLLVLLIVLFVLHL